MFNSPYCSDYIHWVIALDRSGSMNLGTPNSRWEELTDLVNGDGGDPGLLDIMGGDVHSTYMFNHAAIPFPAVDGGPFEHEPVPASLPLDSQTPGGGTSFHAALMKAAMIMDDYLWDHTCFYLITDGESSFSQPAVDAFNDAKAKIKQNCKFCARCYFIQENEDKEIPDNFARICKSIGAPIITSTVNEFKTDFLQDAEASAVAFRASISGTIASTPNIRGSK